MAFDNPIAELFRGQFRSSAKGIADVGRSHFSQAVEMIAICRDIDLSGLDSPEKRRALESVHMSIQTALDAVIAKKSEGGGSQETKRAKLAEAVAKLIHHAKDLGLANDIETRMKGAREKDDKTAEKHFAMTRTTQIHKNAGAEDSSSINMGIIIGMEGLTPPEKQHNVVPDAFGPNHTLNMVLWLLLQHTDLGVKLSDNPHFYPTIKKFSNDVSIKPLAFTQTLGNLEQLRDLWHQQATSPWKSQQREPPKANSRTKTHTIHALKDDGHPIIIKSKLSNGNFYKNIGNVWTATNKVIVLKDVCGTLQPALAIENGIKGSGLCHRVDGRRDNGAGKSVDIGRIWDERSREDTTSREFILEIEEIPVSTAQPSGERVANTARPAIVPAIAADRPVSFTRSHSTSTATTGRTYSTSSTFSDVSSASSASSATLHSGRTTPVAPSDVSTEWVEEPRKVLEKQRAYEAAKQEDEARRAQEIQREREGKREDEERKAQETQQGQEAARKMQRAQQVAKQQEDERKVQEILREREAAKWEVEKRKAQDIRREQEAVKTMQRAQEVAERADEERKAQEMIQKQADDKRIREDREIAEGKRKADMLMQAILEAEAEQKANAAQMAEDVRIEEERVEGQRRKRVEEAALAARKVEEAIAAEQAEEAAIAKKGWFRRAKDWAKGK